ncbi:hypothetical protein HID58_052233, partial [Brassica napus]
ATEAGSKWFELECISSTKECNGEPNISCVTVFECLGLHEFLEQLSQFAHLIVFTADLEDYARPLVDEIDTKHVLNNRLYQPFVLSACKLSSVDHLCLPFVGCYYVYINILCFKQYQDHVKDLLCASKNLCRTLLDIVLPLLKQLSKKKTSDNDRFHMPDWFEKQGIPWSCWTSSSSSLQVPESR